MKYMKAGNMSSACPSCIPVNITICCIAMKFKGKILTSTRSRNTRSTLHESRRWVWLILPSNHFKWVYVTPFAFNALYQCTNKHMQWVHDESSVTEIRLITSISVIMMFRPWLQSAKSILNLKIIALVCKKKPDKNKKKKVLTSTANGVKGAPSLTSEVTSYCDIQHLFQDLSRK